jgi:DNA polymerase-3 subunit gamma/tau
MSEPSPYQSLYRRYRPRRFSEVRGQQHLVAALQNAVREGRVGHAYLLSGPRGTGKTTSARLLAKVLNCEKVVDGEPCLECESCKAIEAGTSFDLHELDAASNNGVEAMRDLISKAGLGTPGRTKVYILDEVHQLSPAASAALLKTLEEPPGHVVFVLATTDPHKVLPTIRSRTQHFELHLIPADELEEHVRWVIKDAGLDVQEDAIAHVLREGGGSARDTLSALDRVVAAGGIDDRSVVIDDVLEALLERDAGAVLAAVHAAVASGRDPRVLGESLVGRLRDAFLAAVGVALDHLPEGDRDRTAALAVRVERPFLTRSLDTIGTALVEMRQAADPRITLETALVKLADVASDTSPAALLERIDRLERALATGGGVAPGAAPAATGAPAAADAPAPAPAGPAAPSSPSGAGGAAADARRKLAERAGSRPAPAAAPAASQPEAPPAPAEPVPPAPAAAPAAAAGGPIEVVDVARAWERVQPALTGVARPRFAPARLLGVEGNVATFSMPNDIHRQRCDEIRGEVEAALGSALGAAVVIRLVTDDGAGKAPAAAAAVPEAPEEEIDLDSLVDAPAEPVKSAADSLVEAFPGAELIEDDP